jgi:hypothetical protein
MHFYRQGYSKPLVDSNRIEQQEMAVTDILLE